MFDIDSELESILVGNRIIQNITLNDTINAVKNFNDNLKDNDIVGIYGVGNDADTLLHFITGTVNGFQIDYCFDKSVISYKFKDVIKNSNVLQIEDINKIMVDYMIIGSYLFRDEFKCILKNVGYKGTVVDFFEPMESYLQEHTSDYRTIYEVKKKYKASQGIEKKDILKELIKEYLLIKDFNSAFLYIDEYIECGCDDIERYKKLKKELLKLLAKIKKTNK